MERRLVPAESPYAAAVGYSRAVRAGSHVYVAGTASVMPGGAEPPADPYAQAKRCLEIVVAALEEVGARPADVVRTRVYLTSADYWEAAARAHREVFGAVLPASAMIVVDGFLDPRFLVEIEADAVVA